MKVRQTAEKFRKKFTKIIDKAKFEILCSSRKLCDFSQSNGLLHFFNFLSDFTLNRVRYYSLSVHVVSSPNLSQSLRAQRHIHAIKLLSVFFDPTINSTQRSRTSHEVVLHVIEQSHAQMWTLEATCLLVAQLSLSQGTL